MRIESLTTQTPFEDIDKAATLEAQVLIDQVRKQQLPTIDLHLPIGVERINRIRQKGLIQYVTETRLNKILGENTVVIEEDIWDGQPFIKFTTDLVTFAALVDRYGDKLTSIL